ncbi:MAG: hypothetical protein ACKPKO_42155, partial [Candidatus Fonsibacter sp.]
GSVGNVCKALGMDVVSLDRDMPADIRTDSMDWDYNTYSPYVVKVMRDVGIVIPVHDIRSNVCRHVPVQRHIRPCQEPCIRCLQIPSQRTVPTLA